MTDTKVKQRTGASGDRLRAVVREQLLVAGLELFGVYGYADTTVDALCAEAGVPEAVFREEYDSPEGLLIALHNRVSTKGMRAAENVQLAEDIDECTAQERVRRLFDAYVNAVTRDPREARVAFVEVLGVSRAVDEHCRRWRETWVEFYSAATERAVGRGEAVNTDHRADVIVMVNTILELMAHHSRRPRRARPEDVSGELTYLALTLLTTE
ncbi:TetR/AcrR family transcriptional regulator [Streptomyces sp. NPDC057136]|uniref:TetR/AcrR family transcriptional regulator n=1 Tax=Streptomyces sp. NPDC057136 TaxID=3346029 RepID=UPI00363A945C